MTWQYLTQARIKVLQTEISLVAHSYPAQASPSDFVFNVKLVEKAVGSFLN